MWQVSGSGQSQHRGIIAPESTLQSATMIVQRPFVHGATLTMIGKQPESRFELRSRQGGHLDMDRVVIDHFVPRLDPVQDLSREVCRLPGLVYLGARRRRHYVLAGLFADHP